MKKRTQFAMTIEVLEKAFSLPEGASITNVRFDPARNIVHFYTIGTGEDTPEGQECIEVRMEIVKPQKELTK